MLKIANAAVRSIAERHVTGVAAILAAHRRPHPPHVVKCIQTIAEEPSLTEPLIVYCLDALKGPQQYSDVAMPDTKKEVVERTMDEVRTSATVAAASRKVAKELPSSITCLLNEIFSSPALNQFAAENMVRLVSSLILRIGIAHYSANRSSVLKEAVTALVTVLQSAGEDAAASSLIASGIPGDNDYDFLVGVGEAIGKVLESGAVRPEDANDNHDRINRFFQANFEFLSRPAVGHVQAATCIISQLLRCLNAPVDGMPHYADSKRLEDSVVNALLQKTGGSEGGGVRVEAIRGLKYVAMQKIIAPAGLSADAPAPENAGLNVYATPVLSALLTSVEERPNVLSLESLYALDEIINVAPVASVAPILVSICLRIRALFDRDNARIRAGAISLLGVLARFGKSSSAAPELRSSSRSCERQFSGSESGLQSYSEAHRAVDWIS